MTLGEALAGGHGDNPLAELYRDETLLIVHKPAGLLVHRSPIDRHETEFALQYARSLNGAGGCTRSTGWTGPRPVCWCSPGIRTRPVLWGRR